MQLPAAKRGRWWSRPGISRRGERVFEIAGAVVFLLFAVGWTWSVAHAEPVPAGERGGMSRAGATISAALTNPNAPSTAYLTDATLNAITARMLSSARGASGKMRATIQAKPGALAPDTLPEGGSLRYSQGGEVVEAPRSSGIWNVVLAVGNAIRPVADFAVINLIPFNTKQSGRIGTYFIGNWPSERGKVGPKAAPPEKYANPAGFIEVTRENADTRVSEHFKLRNFLTKDQPNVWPKYLVLEPKLIDKLELVLNDLASRGIDVSGVTVMSGFRTPRYNAGGGNTSGRADLSRHMYGDASDIYIDSNRDGNMDDLNKDGRISIEDSRVIQAAVDRVEAAHPELIGGAGVYTATSGHGPFIHIDTRGYRARWMGTSGG
jgi:uncharacterized protein YcbK (DUF882 family)